MKKTTAIKFSALLLCLCTLLSFSSCEHAHRYSDWTPAGEELHIRTCKGCETAEVASHGFDTGVITKEPTLSTEGEIVYTCTDCGYKKTECTPAKVVIELQEFETWDIHSVLQKKFLSGDPNLVNNYATGSSELSYPASRTFNWTLKCEDETVKADHYVYAISENEDMSDAVESTSRFNDYSADKGGQNLKVRTKYYWQVTAVLADGTEVKSKISTFETTGWLRNIHIDGVANARDIGGKDCTGGIIKQGLIYRTGRLHNSYDDYTTVKISNRGIQTMLGLGIKTEIDLRGKIVGDYYENGTRVDGTFKFTESVLGSSVKYYWFGATYSNTMLNGAEGKKMVKNTFAVFADENNYPLFFHCSIGTDRTGIIAILLEGVLGVDKEIIYYDYLFSNFGNIGSKRDHERWDGIMSTIECNAGTTFQEQCYSTLIKCGVSAEQIQSIKDIRIEK